MIESSGHPARRTAAAETCKFVNMGQGGWKQCPTSNRDRNIEGKRRKRKKKKDSVLVKVGSARRRSVKVEPV